MDGSGNKPTKCDWDMESTSQSQGIWNTVNSIVDKMSLSYFCKKINDLLKGASSMEEENLLQMLSVRIIRSVLTQEGFVSEVFNSSTVDKVTDRLREGIDCLLAINWISRVAVEEVPFLSWNGMDGIASHFSELTEEEKELKQSGSMDEMDRYKMNAASLEEAVEKERIYGHILRQNVQSEGDKSESTFCQTVPFVALSTNVSGEMLCEVNQDNKSVFFESTTPVTIYTDREVLYSLARNSQQQS